MNVAELARKLNISPVDLREMLPRVGFDIGMKAIKVDDRTAQTIMREWNRLRRDYERMQIEAQRKAQELNKKDEGVAVQKKKVKIPAVVTVRQFADFLNLPVTAVIKELMKNGILASVNERIDFESATIVAEDLGFEVSREEAKDTNEETTAQERLKGILKKESETGTLRPPVVVVMGHVDHGKTKLLDQIRQENVVASEAGGITQHIGAYQAIKKDRKITFIDTPGHEAFTVMRSRGARVADIAIVVVAADDGIQPQTLEVVKIVQAAKIPFIVAINKIDKPTADIERIKSQLAEIGLLPEDWGGKTICVPVSAKEGTGISDLLDMILLVADMDKEKISSNPNRNALGTIIESDVNKGEGIVATALVQAGTLHVNEALAINGELYGRVRAMRDWTGSNVAEADPGMPVKLLGFKIAPQVGDIWEVPVGDEKLKKAKKKEVASDVTQFVKKENEHAGKKIFNFILKTDMLGSLEALFGSIDKFSHPDVGAKVIGKGLGNITEADIMRALPSGVDETPAVVYGFNVSLTPQAAELARDKGVEVKLYKIIYELLDNIKTAMEKMLLPERFVTLVGRVKVLAIFKVEKNNIIAGGLVVEGKIVPDLTVKIKKNDKEVGVGKLVGLQMGRRDAKEAGTGNECGLNIQTRDTIEEGNALDLYKEEIKTRKLSF
jgi:translation initiation factor IF-2